MASMGDLPKVCRSVGPWKFAKNIWAKMQRDDLLVWASALAYSWLFAVFPFIIFLLTLVPYLPEGAKESARHSIRHTIYQSLGPDAAKTVWSNVERFILHLDRPHAGVLSLGLLVTLWAASSGMYMTMGALDKCFAVPNVRWFYMSRLWAIVLTLVMATMVLAVTGLLPVGSAVMDWMRARYPGDFSGALVWAWDVARWSLSTVLLFLGLGLVYHLGVNIRQRFSLVTPGALFVIVVWTLLAAAFRFYLARFGSYDKVYGTVAGVAALLLIFYVDALVLLVGAQINAEIDFACGIERGTRDFRRPKRAG